jgi:hypothetical protein
MGCVCMINQLVGSLKGFVTDRTGAVVERDVLADTGCRTELRIAGCACV